MQEHFKIYVDQLRDGHIEEIDERFSPDFLDVNEDGLRYTNEVLVNGQAYLADADFVLHLNAEATAMMPCSICNEKVLVPVTVTDCYHAEPVKEIKGRVFNFSGLIREAILLETPHFAECNNGHCSHRKDLASYLKKESNPASDKQKDGDEGYQPFIDLIYPEDR